MNEFEIADILDWAFYQGKKAAEQEANIRRDWERIDKDQREKIAKLNTENSELMAKVTGAPF